MHGPMNIKWKKVKIYSSMTGQLKTGAETNSETSAINNVGRFVTKWCGA